MKMVKLKLQIERHKIQRPVYLSDERFKKMQEEEKRRNESDKKWTKHLADVREAIENQYNVDKDRGGESSNMMTDVDATYNRKTDKEEEEYEEGEGEEEEYNDDFDENGEERDDLGNSGNKNEGHDSDVNPNEKKNGTADPTGNS